MSRKSNKVLGDFLWVQYFLRMTFLVFKVLLRNLTLYTPMEHLIEAATGGAL